MPYIRGAVREYYELRGFRALRDTIATTTPPPGAGELAYLVYRLLLEFAPAGMAFDRRNAMMGAVLEAVAEYRRRIHEPAEDEAIARNGDIG